MTQLMKLDASGQSVPLSPQEVADLAALQGGAALPPMLLAPITAAQLAIALMKRGVITAPEAEEFAASGAIPAPLAAQINTALAAANMSEQQRAVIRIKLRGALEYRRQDSAVPIIGAALGLDAAALDTLWRDAAAL